MGKIQDGKGSGRLAEVGTDHRLKVSSIASDRAVQSNINGEAYLFATPIFLIGAGAEHKIAYINNGETQQSLVIDIETLSFDGGTTSNSKPLFVKYYINASVPTTNSVSKDPIGLNTESAGQGSADFKVWDGVATGFVQVAPGSLLTEAIFAMGNHHADVPSKLILGPAKTLSYSVECEEACKVTLQVIAHILDDS
jgi:hypothetical protein